MAPGNKSSVILEHTLALVRWPSLGPLLIGLLFGGIPFGMFLVHLGLTDRWGDSWAGYLRLAVRF